MGCGGDREKAILETQKWDYINLSDFHSRSCWTPLTYVALYIALGISLAVYVFDILIAGNLLFSSHWAGRVQPQVPWNFEITKWIFVGCIVATWVFLAYRYWRAIRAIKSGGIAQSYLDPLAVRLQSVRMGKGRGWKRFLVFAEMTKGKKGVDYIALFTYFSFEASYRIILAEGPRNVINAMTLWAILHSQILNKGGKDVSSASQFFNNVKAMADGDWLTSAVLIGMLFVLVVWVIAAISLILSVFFYIFFLWHQIPKSDRSLGAYCRRKVDKTLSRVVDKKVTKALNKADAAFDKEHAMRGRAGESIANIKQAPTLPSLSPSADDRLTPMPLSRTGTMSSQPSYTSYDQPPPRPFIHRSGTNMSAASYSSYGSDAPLINDASPMGHGIPRSNTPGQYSARGPTMSPMPGHQPSPHPITRSNTGFSNMSGNSYGMPPPPRSNTGFGNYPQGRSSPAPGRGGPIQEFEMRSHTPQSNVRGNASSPFGYAMPNRAFTSPTQSQHHPPPRSFTPAAGPYRHGSPAPGGYPDSIYDHY